MEFLHWNRKQMSLKFIKDDKQSLANYRLISHFPTCRKLSEHLLYNKMFDFFITNDFICTNKSDFNPEA